MINSLRLSIVSALPIFVLHGRISHVHSEAMDRIHRLGQHRPVKAIKLVIQDSIESRIVQVW
jgi:hypothetical protein